VLTREDPRATTVPEEALVTFAGVTKLFVVAGDAASAVPVEPGVRIEVASGQRVEHWVEVRGELPEGSPVVTSGQTQLADGTAVRLREEIAEQSSR